MGMVPITPKNPIGGDVKQLMRDLERALTDVTAGGHRLLSRYPVQPMGSRYKRTHTLQRSWNKEVKKTAVGVEGIVYSNANEAPYNVYVQGPKDMDITIPGRSGGKGQLPWFEDSGWLSVSVVARTMQNDLNEKLDKIFGKGGT